MVVVLLRLSSRRLIPITAVKHSFSACFRFSKKTKKLLMYAELRSEVWQFSELVREPVDLPSRQQAAQQRTEAPEFAQPAILVHLLSIHCTS